MTVRILHFADAHIDIANYGRHDPETGLPHRVVDFLKALDQIVEAALSGDVDLVIFAGDAYRDRNPQPTFQREWGRRMMRLSEAGIPTLLLVGNHDIAPAEKRAHTMQEFNTLGVPHILVADDAVQFWGPDDLGVPIQLITLPWVTRSRFLARHEVGDQTANEVLDRMEDIVAEAIEAHIDSADPGLPLVLVAHASVVGAVYGSERQVMLGHEVMLSSRVIRDQRLDYVALGHIHRHQSVNEHPPAVYPGSIERIDFGEAKEEKGYVLANVERGRASWRFVPLETRPFVDEVAEAREADGFMAEILGQLPSPDRVRDAICRITVRYPQDLEPLLDEKQIRSALDGAFDIRIKRDRLAGSRSRLPDTVKVEAMSPHELLDLYWDVLELPEEEVEAMRQLAKDVLIAQDTSPI